MDNKNFTKLLKRAAAAAVKHKNLCDEVNEECIKRHGVTYSEVDADGIIDVLDIDGGEIDAVLFDAEIRLAIRLSR